MATVDSRQTTSGDYDRDIHGALNRLRWMIRAYVLVEGIAWCIIFASLAFWFSLAVDWLFEPSRTVRTVLLVAYAGVVGYVFLRRVVGRAAARLSDASMAVLLERRYGTFHDSLLTSIELEGRKSSEAGYNDGMLRHTRHEAAELVRNAGLAGVFDMAPLLRAGVIALLLAASVALFGSSQTNAMGIWGNRNILLGNRLWDRISKIEVDGFEQVEGRRVHKVAKGGGVMVNAYAVVSEASDREEGQMKVYEIPEAILVEYQSEAGVGGSSNMTKIAQIDTQRGQPFRYSFENVQSSTQFSVVAKHDALFGKADRIDDLWIEVVPSPELKDIRLESKYPDYLEKRHDTLQVTGVMSVPEGTEVVVVAQATKPLLAVECVVNTPEATRTISIIPDAGDRGTFRCDIGKVEADTELLFTMTDNDRVANRQPIRLQINMIPDEPPVVEARFVGIGTAITPKAMLPLAGEVSDDHGLAKTWFEYRIDNDEVRKHYFPTPANGQLEQDPPLLFDAMDLAMTPGQKFRISVKASDNYALASEPHIESSRTEVLDVVDESQLLAILEDHEAVLRRRFEEIFERMNQSSDSLARIDLNAIFTPESTEDELPAASDSTEASGASADETPASDSAEAETPPDAETPAEEADGGPAEEPAEPTAEESDEDAVDLDDAAAEPATTPAARLRSIAMLSVDEALQNGERSGHETREIAGSFEDILVELRNNRVSYFDEKELRLKTQIAEPMHDIADLHYPRLDEKLKELRLAVEQGDRIAAEVALASSKQEINAILVEMTDILGKMKELQSFNKVLARFREIIASHDRISLLTKQRREELMKDLKKGLLED